MNKEKYILKVGNQEKEFESVGDAVSYTKAKTNRFNSGTVFEIQQVGKTVLKYRFIRFETIDIEIIENKKAVNPDSLPLK